MDHGYAHLIVLIAVAGIGAQWLAWRLRIPAIMVLLLLGLVVGPGTGFLDPQRMFGDLLQPLIGLGVALIVFDGGLNLNLRELRETRQALFRLIVVGMPLSWLFGSLVGHAIGGLSWPLAILLGAILTITGPTVILPLLREAKLDRRAASILKWKSIINEPVGTVLATIVLQYLLLSNAAGGREAVFWEMIARIVIGLQLAAVFGVGLAFLVRWAFEREQVPEYLKTPILLSLTLGLYAVMDVFLAEVGLVACTIFGVALANLHITGIQELRRFKESITLFVESGLFIVLAAALDADALSRMSWPIIATTLAVMFIVRPAAILLSTIRDHTSWRERILVAWIGPRGIVVAAIAGIAATHLHEIGFADADLLLSIVFAVVIATILAAGLTFEPLATRLGLASHTRPGLLIAGASAWTVALASELRRTGVPVILADSSPHALQRAKDVGLEAYQGELLSERGEFELDLRSVGYLLAATGDDAYNALICSRYAPELGRERVYQLPFRSGTTDLDAELSREWRGKIIMAPRLGYRALHRLLGRGWRFVSRQAGTGEPLGGGDLDAGWPVVLVGADGGLKFAAPRYPATAMSGDILIRFVPPEPTTSP